MQAWTNEVQCGALVHVQLDSTLSRDLGGLCLQISQLRRRSPKGILDPLLLVPARCASLCHGICKPLELTVQSLSQHVTTAG